MMFRIYSVRECASTQDLARELAERGWDEGTVVIADRMTAGRGRLGRRWVADEGGLWMTIILRPKAHVSLQLINLIAGLSVVEGINKLYDVPLSLKWPNDVLLDGRKLCGILSEARIAGNVVDYVLLGVGVNVNNELRGELKDIAISLKEYLGFHVPMGPLLNQFLRGLDVGYSSMLAGRVEEIIGRWKALSATIGRRVKVITSEDVVEGLASDIDLDGALIVRTDGGVVKVYSGDVIHLIINGGGPDY